MIIILNLVFINLLTGQNTSKYKKYDQKNFDKNRVSINTYHLWWYKNRWAPSVKDTLPYFVDDRNYKGIINYGVEFRSKDYRTFNFFEDVTMYFLNIEVKNCKFNPNDNKIEIVGFVSGGWGEEVKNGWNETENNIDIFIGEKKDTVNACYFGDNINKDNIEVKWNNKIIDDFVILDTFPSFYMKNYSYYRTVPKGKRPFKIIAKVDKNTILAFGARNCYSEIFEIGAMIYSPQKNKLKKGIKKQEMVCQPLIIKNKLVADIENEKTAKKTINYYTYTEKAENYIITRQYAKAKEQYNLLIQNYPIQFARDIHNAIRCAILSRDIKTAFLWCEKLASKGVTMAYFNAKIFTGLKKNANWIPFSVKYDSLYKLNQTKLNLNLKQQIEALLNEDQSDYGLATRKDPKIMFETTVRVTDKLIELLRKEGFPSEEKIGTYVKNDTTLVSSPDYNVLIRHAFQQKPKNTIILNELLDKSIDVLEYDSKRSPNNIMDYNSCFHIYKGNLYNDKSCGNNDLMVKKIIFKFNNPYSFIIDYGNYITTEYNKENPKEYDTYYEQRFNFIMKLTDDWEFYEK